MSYGGYRATTRGGVSILYIYPRVRAVGFSIATIGATTLLVVLVACIPEKSTTGICKVILPYTISVMLGTDKEMTYNG